MATGGAVNVASDSSCALCRVFIVQGEYLIRIAHPPCREAGAAGRNGNLKKWERKNMKKGTAVGFMAVVASVLLATVTSVYANHTATGKGTYAVAPQILAEFHFVLAKQGPNPDLEPGLIFVQSAMAGGGEPRSFQTFMISTATAPLNITTESAGRTVTIKGEMVSTTFLGVGSERQHFAELVSFTAIGVDKRTSEPGADFFSLEVIYSNNQVQGPLFASFGFGDCDAETCIITFDGLVKTGDIFVHTAGDE
jgi:hypothetical protein